MNRKIFKLLGILICAFFVFTDIYADNLVLLGKKDEILFDQAKQLYMTNTLKALLASCTVKTVVLEIPAVEYKGIRLTRDDGTIIEAHIFPHSISSYYVQIYTLEKGIKYLYGKYADHAYQLIAMLELKDDEGR